MICTKKKTHHDDKSFTFTRKQFTLDNSIESHQNPILASEKDDFKEAEKKKHKTGDTKKDF